MAESAASTKANKPSKPALTTEEFIPFELKSVERVNHNTARFKFALPEGTTELGLPVTSCLVTKHEKVVRPYTPIEHDDGTFDLVIKKYPDGKMSSHIHSLKPKDKLLMKGPFGKWSYEKGKLNEAVFIAGGSGITPFLQLASSMALAGDKAKLKLIFGNVTEEDILLRDEIESLKKKMNLDIVYVLNKPPAGWKGESGNVNKDLLSKELPKPGSGGMVFICGPDKMLEIISGTKAPDKSQGEIGGYLKELGYSSDEVFKF